MNEKVEGHIFWGGRGEGQKDVPWMIISVAVVFLKEEREILRSRKLIIDPPTSTVKSKEG